MKDAMFAAVGRVFIGLLGLALLVGLSVGMVYLLIVAWGWAVTLAGFPALVIKAAWNTAFAVWAVIALIRLIFFRRKKEQ